MAIQRCPYCKAIIDEGAEYCTNCGTKLLFPEDEFIDEEIPGEKIIDVDDDVSGIQQELKEKTGEVPPVEEEEPGEDELPGEEAEAAPPEEDEDSELEKELAAIEEELLEEEAKQPEKKPSPKKRTTSRKRKVTRKKPAAKKTKKEEPVKVVEDEEPQELEHAAETDAVAEEELTPAEDVPPIDEIEPADDIMEPEEETPADEDWAAAGYEPPAAEDNVDEITEDPLPEAEAPAGDVIEPDAEPQEIQDEIAEEEAEIRDARHGLTDDLPEGFAQAIDEARERSGEPLEEPQPQEIDEPLEDEEAEEEMLTPEPGTAEEKEWQTPPAGEEVLAEPGTQDEETIQTGDIEDIVDEAEKEKEEIDDFIASIKKERQSVREQIKSDTEDIPPWAENVQDGPLPDIPPTDEIVFKDRAESWEAEEAEEPEAVEPSEIEELVTSEEAPSPVDEEAQEAPGPGYDTRSAFPETVDQQGLPFVKTTELPDEDIGESLDEDIDAGIVMDSVEDEPERKTIRVRRKSESLGFGDWIKARAFDVVFVTVLWFVALWIASQVVGVTVFRLIAGSAPVAILFLGTLLLIYFFFFLYFLGETLGNYLFSSEE